MQSKFLNLHKKIAGSRLLTIKIRLVTFDCSR